MAWKENLLVGDRCGGVGGKWPFYDSCGATCSKKYKKKHLPAATLSILNNKSSPSTSNIPGLPTPSSIVFRHFCTPSRNSSMSGANSCKYNPYQRCIEFYKGNWRTSVVSTSAFGHKGEGAIQTSVRGNKKALRFTLVFQSPAQMVVNPTLLYFFEVIKGSHQIPADIDADNKIDKLSTFLSTFLPYHVSIEGESPISRYKR